VTQRAVDARIVNGGSDGITKPALSPTKRCPGADAVNAMIPPMKTPPPPKGVPKSDKRIYITQLAQIVDREVGTIRKWQREGRLPKRLFPKRGYRKWRCWTREQVFGRNGIVKWMAKNDVRPGNIVTPPEREAEHVEHLRRPKKLTGHHVNSVKRMVANGKNADQIIKKIYPRTTYARPENLEAALRRYFTRMDWDFPPASEHTKSEQRKQRTRRETRAQLERAAA
jgi:hypothetical protein